VHHKHTVTWHPNSLYVRVAGLDDLLTSINGFNDLKGGCISSGIDFSAKSVWVDVVSYVALGSVLCYIMWRTLQGMLLQAKPSRLYHYPLLRKHILCCKYPIVVKNIANGHHLFPQNFLS